MGHFDPKLNNLTERETHKSRLTTLSANKSFIIIKHPIRPRVNN